MRETLRLASSLLAELKIQSGPSLVPLLVNDLFATPVAEAPRSNSSPTGDDEPQPPRCKTDQTREATFLLLIGLCEDNLETMCVLLKELLALVSAAKVSCVVCD